MKSRVLVILPVLLGLMACGGKPEVLFNESWRENIKDNVRFPLEEKITVIVGYKGDRSGDGADSLENLSLKWLEEQTNIHLDIVGVDTGPQNINIGGMMRAGTFPDVFQEGAFSLADENIGRRFVDILEFPHLTPRFNALLKNDEQFLNGILGRLTPEGRLYSMGTYNLTNLPYIGALAFRKDTFQKYGLKHETWDQLFASLKKIKREFPDSRPFGAALDDILYQGPAMFRSGMDRTNVCYFHPERREWVFGPGESTYREFLQFFANLYQEELLDQDLLLTKDESTETRSWLQGVIQMGIANRTTGYSYDWISNDYGSLTEDGAWDGNGVWVAAMEIPRNRQGERGWISTEPWTNVGRGWIINTQSPNVSEIIALMDYLYSEEAALIMKYGPEGVIWDYIDSNPRMKSFIQTPYNLEGTERYPEYLEARGEMVGSPIQGLSADSSGILGWFLRPEYLYYRLQDVEAYYGSGSLIVTPKPLLLFDNDESIKTITLSNALDTQIAGTVSQTIMGNRPIEEFDEFLGTLDKIGKTELCELLNARSVELSGNEFLRGR